MIDWTQISENWSQATFNVTGTPAEYSQCLIACSNYSDESVFPPPTHTHRLLEVLQAFYVHFAFVESLHEDVCGFFFSLF